MRIEIEADFTKHLVTKWLLRVTALLYHQTWTIFENNTGYEFLTSDNRSAIIPKDHPNQLLLVCSRFHRVSTCLLPLIWDVQISIPIPQYRQVTTSNAFAFIAHVLNSSTNLLFYQLRISLSRPVRTTQSAWSQSDRIFV